MHNTNRIGILAEKIVAVRFTMDGLMTPFVRQRETNGRMVDRRPLTFHKTNPSGPTEFVVRVRCGDRGVAGIGTLVWKNYYYDSVLPLGGKRYLESETPSRKQPSDEGPQLADDSSLPDEIRFRFADGKLSWTCEGVSGETVVNETYPEVEVSLRLPPGNDGEISFASPIFTTAAGEPSGVLAVA